VTDNDLTRDIEESADELDRDEPQEWVGAHNQVVFSAIDYSLEQIADQAVRGELDLQPGYQRRLRWSVERKSRLIESFLMNVPVPPVYLAEEPDGVYAVIDGKQRITAIADFLERGLQLKGLSYYADLNGLSFEQLPKEERDFLNRRISLRAVIILGQSPPEIKLETFQRLNTGGVQLNAQEIRNIAFRGPLNDLTMELSELPLFHRMLKIQSSETSTIHQHMRDAELVLRFLAFREDWEQFDGSVKGHMDTFMQVNRDMAAPGLAVLRASFIESLELVDAAYGEHAFERWQPEKKRWRRQVVAAVYDAQMLGSLGFSADNVGGRREQVLAGLQQLFAQKRFRESTEAATNAQKAFKYRITSIRRLLRRILK